MEVPLGNLCRVEWIAWTRVGTRPAAGQPLYTAIAPDPAPTAPGSRSPREEAERYRGK